MEGLTKEYFDQWLEKLATKQDLNKAVASLTTKEELEQAIKPLATKKELEKLATKDELNELARMVAEGFADIQRRLDVRERLTMLENKFERLAKELHIAF